TTANEIRNYMLGFSAAVYVWIHRMFGIKPLRVNVFFHEREYDRGVGFESSEQQEAKENETEKMA
ncbi:MAG: hypothetical protein Q4A66_13005, partial [Eubacteriales bacterium]|nr:hypothetical protein [Eubacteriales bacterium]